MKKLLLFIYASVCGTATHAQIILNTGDLPQIGDIHAYYKKDSTALNPGPAGANQTWNFNSLTGDADTNYYLNPASTPNGTSFPASSICVLRETGNNYLYCSAGAGGMKIVGFDDNPGVFLLDIQGYEFPLLTYPNSVTHDFRAKQNIVTANTYDAIFVHHVSTADGWGTIITPAGSISAIRVYTVETSYDSSYVAGVGTQNGTGTGYYYRWYAKNIGWPVLEIAKGVMGEPDYERTFYAADLTVGINEHQENRAEVFPNPFTTMFQIKTEKEMHDATLVIYDAVGCEVYKKINCFGREINVQNNNLQPGTYIYKLMSAEYTITGKVVKE